MRESDLSAAEWGRKVLAARTRLELTQDEFAREIGTTSKSVSNWERARVVPRLAQRRRLALVLRPEDEEAAA